MGVGGRSNRDRIYVYIELIHFIVQQKLTQHCKAIILQFKKIVYFLQLLLIIFDMATVHLIRPGN